MTVNVRSLADFKRFLARPGATVQVIRNDWSDPNVVSRPITTAKDYWEPRQVAKLQSNAVRFTTNSWLQFPKAAHVRFNGDTMEMCMNADSSFKHVLIYKLSEITQEAPHESDQQIHRG